MHALLVLLGHPIAFFVSLNRRNNLFLAALHALSGWLYIVYVLYRTKFYDGYQEYKSQSR